jgi:hypothetical protein
MLMHTCCCIFIYVVSGFDRIQKGVQNLLKMNLQNYFIKEKGNPLFSSPLSWFLAHWPNQPTICPLLLQAQMGAAPLFLRPGRSWPLAPLLGPAHRPSRSCARVTTRLAR